MTDIISREAARKSGRKLFFLGEMCKRGHVSERYVASNMCVECQAIVAAEMQEKARCARAPIYATADEIAAGIVEACALIAATQKQPHALILAIVGIHTALPSCDWPAIVRGCGGSVKAYPAQATEARRAILNFNALAHKVAQAVKAVSRRDAPPVDLPKIRLLPSASPRDITALLMGDPDPGRSALAQKSGIAE